MTKTDIDNQQQIDAYLRNELDAESRILFEVALIEDAELLRAVQRTEAMIAAFKAQPELFQAQRRSRVLRFSEWIVQPLSLAASFLVLLGLLPVIALLSGSGEPGAISGLNVASVQYVERLRGNDSATRVRGSFPMLLQIDSGAVDNQGQFEVRLIDVDQEQVLFTQSNLVADADSLLRLLINESLYGSCKIEISQQSVNGQVLVLAPYEIIFEN